MVNSNLMKHQMGYAMETMTQEPLKKTSTDKVAIMRNDGSQDQKYQSAQMLENANRTTDFLKSLAHAGRLMILCRLAEGSATVTQLEEMLHMSQSSVSKQLSRLREEDFVQTERKGRSIYYSLSDDRARQIVGLLYTMFCDSPKRNQP